MHYPHQNTEIDLLKRNDVYALFMEMGTGKTLVAIKCNMCAPVGHSIFILTYL